MLLSLTPTDWFGNARWATHQSHWSGPASVDLCIYPVTWMMTRGNNIFFVGHTCEQWEFNPPQSHSPTSDVSERVGFSNAPWTPRKKRKRNLTFNQCKVSLYCHFLFSQVTMRVRPIANSRLLMKETKHFQSKAEQVQQLAFPFVIHGDNIRLASSKLIFCISELNFFYYIASSLSFFKRCFKSFQQWVARWKNSKFVESNFSTFFITYFVAFCIFLKENVDGRCKIAIITKKQCFLVDMISKSKSTKMRTTQKSFS